MNTSISAVRPQRLMYLDFIRVVSLLLIILYHYNAQINDLYPGAQMAFGLTMLHQPIGDIGVTLFLIVSGAALMTSENSQFSTLKFAKKRALAIYPSFWLAYLAVSVVLFLRRGVAQGSGEYAKFPLTALGMDGFFGPLIPSNYYLIGEWFIGFIIIMYFFFPLLRKGALRRPIATLLTLTLISLVAEHFNQEIFFSAPNRNPLVRLPEFFFGICFYRYIYPNLGRCALVALIALFSMQLVTIALSAQISGFLLGVSVFVILAYAAEQSSQHSTATILLEKMSRLSFLAFLVHHWVIYIIFEKLDPRNLSLVEIFYLLTIIVGLSFAAAFALSLIVSPCIRLIQNRIST